MRSFGMRFTASVAAISLGLFLSALSGCAPTAQAPKPEEKAAVKEKPQYGGIHRFNTQNPRIGMDPHRTTGTSHYNNFGRAYSSLLNYKFAPDISETTFILAPDLGERWENPTPTTWLLYLRKGVKWHNVPPVNGREFTADDAVYNVNRLAGEGSAQRGYWLDLDKVEAVDRYTVKFTLKNPVSTFLTILALGFNKMVAKEAVEAGGGNLDKGPLVGTGPWFVNCTVDVECVFKRNPDFHLKDDDGNQLPYMDGMLGLVIPDVQAIFAAFRAKQIDSVGLSNEEREIVARAQPEVIVRNYRRFAAQMIHFRNDKPPWNDDRVRAAVSKAVNRQEIIDTIYGGRGYFYLAFGVPAEDWFLPQDEYKKAYQPDTEGAKKLLAEAGYTNGLDTSLWCANYGVNDIPACELLVAQLGKAGIRAKINVHDVPTYLSKVFVRDGQFDDLAWGPQGAFPEPDLWLSAYYHSQGGRNSGHVKDPKLDGMIEAQRRELNPEKRKQIILDIQRYLLQKNYQIVVNGSVVQNGYWPWLKNVSVSAGTDYPSNRYIDYYWIDQELRKKMGAPE